jgi:hypothetical protein
MVRSSSSKVGAEGRRAMAQWEVVVGRDDTSVASDPPAGLTYLEQVQSLRTLARRRRKRHEHQVGGRVYLTDARTIAGDNLTVCGDGNHVMGNYNLVIGRGNTVAGVGCRVRGDRNRVMGRDNTAMGRRNKVSGPGSVSAEVNIAASRLAVSASSQRGATTSASDDDLPLTARSEPGHDPAMLRDLLASSRVRPPLPELLPLRPVRPPPPVPTPLSAQVQPQPVARRRHRKRESK